MDLRTLNSNELDKWLDFCAFVFGGGIIDDDYRLHFEKHFKNDPQATYSDILIAVDNSKDDEKIISSAHIFTRRVFICGKSLSMGGIGKVCTHPSYRSQGLSSAILKKSTELMKKQNINVSFLFTEDNHAHFAKQGYQKIEYPSLDFTVTASPSYDYSIKKADFETDLQTMQKLYEKTALRFSCVLDRFEDSYWKKWITEELKEAHIIYDGPTPIAYFTPIIDIENKKIVFKEFICLPKIFDDVLLKTASYLAFLNEIDIAEISQIPKISKISEKAHIQNIKSDMMINLITSFDIEGNNIKTTAELVSVINKMPYPIWFYKADMF